MNPLKTVAPPPTALTDKIIDTLKGEVECLYQCKWRHQSDFLILIFGDIELFLDVVYNIALKIPLV